MHNTVMHRLLDFYYLLVIGEIHTSPGPLVRWPYHLGTCQDPFSLWGFEYNANYQLSVICYTHESTHWESKYFYPDEFPTQEKLLVVLLNRKVA